MFLPQCSSRIVVEHAHDSSNSIRKQTLIHCSNVVFSLQHNHKKKNEEVPTNRCTEIDGECTEITDEENSAAVKTLQVRIA
jgi:hypothetical protein